MPENDVLIGADRRGGGDDARLLDTKELAAQLGCSVSTVKRQVAAGAIPVVRIGRLVRFRRGDVAVLIDALTAPPALGHPNGEEGAL